MKKSSYKPLPTKKIPKADREQAVLFGLIELYLKTGKPIGSQTIQEQGFGSFSSATIRNYFCKLEESGFLKQPHTSGGRIPTEKGLRLYTDFYQNQGIIEKEQEAYLEKIFDKETKEIGTTLHRACDTLSELSQCAVFISTPRFDQDFIRDIKLVGLDPTKLLIVLITDFGLIHTETIYLEKEADPLFLRTCEEYFLWRISKGEKPLFDNEAETKTAQKIYNEIMVRHVVGYANFPNEEILRTGLSKLLSYPEFNDATALASSLSLLEDETLMRSILRETTKQNKLTCWVGDELSHLIPSSSDCTIISIPYYINHISVGSIALLGPTRLPYRNLFGLCQLFSEKISQSLTTSLYKHKISFRKPTKETLIENKTTGIDP
jgi:heat-inducible transcriptional repressor